jgi:hypothetical protein
MINHGAGLVMLDPDRGFVPCPVSGPLDVSRNYVLGALEPFKANHCRSSAFWLTALHATISKRIDLFAISRRLGL